MQTLQGYWGSSSDDDDDATGSDKCPVCNFRDFRGPKSEHQASIAALKGRAEKCPTCSILWQASCAVTGSSRPDAEYQHMSIPPPLRTGAFWGAYIWPISQESGNPGRMMRLYITKGMRTEQLNISATS